MRGDAYNARMQIFRVGGSVRDELLGLVPHEIDWVVVGETPEALLSLGYRAVGKDFPVFLHPKSHEEYALARTERKTAPGYRGFQVDSSPDITLEEDLLRRDLTINAMARDAQGQLVDPYCGEADLAARVLRHVSPAFAEDPVRILRAARFAARFASFGFTLAPETNALMQQMVNAGEVDALVPERVWKETEKALLSEHPDVFFGVLRDCGALAVIFPEIEHLFGVPQPARWHPEIDTGVHLMMTLQQVVKLSDDGKVRYAVLTHDLGKGTTPTDVLPSHRGHEERSVDLLEAMSERLRVPRGHRELAVAVARYHGQCHRLADLRSGTVLKLLKGLDAFRRPQRVGEFALACEADARGRLGLELDPYPQRAQLLAYYEAAASAALDAGEREHYRGKAYGEQLDHKRIQAIKAVRRSLATSQ